MTKSNDNTISSSRAFMMWFIVTFFFMYQFVVRVLPNILMPVLRERFQIDMTMYGQFSGIYYIGYTAMHIPVGLMLDRVGPKKVVSICALLVSAGILPLIYSSNWSEPTIGRLLIGMGSSAATLGCFKIISIAFKEENFNKILGITVFFGFMGAMYGGTPVEYLMKEFGIDFVLHALVFIGLLISAFSYLIMPNMHLDKDAKKETIWSELKTVISNYQIIFIALLGGLMVGPVEGFADVWGAEFLKTVYNLPEQQASFLPSLIFLGFALGSPLLSFMADYTRAFFAILISCGLIMFVSFVFLLSNNAASPIILTGLFLIIGIASAYQLVVLYLASISVQKHMVGLATAWANMIVMSFGYVFHSLIGSSMDYYWTGDMVDNVKTYNIDAYINSIGIIPTGIAIAVIGITYLKYHNFRVMRKKKALQNIS